MKLSEELRNKKSRDNRELLDRAADRIDVLEHLLVTFVYTIGNFATAVQPSANEVARILGIDERR